MAHPEMMTLNFGLFLVAVALPLFLFRKSLSGWPFLVLVIQAMLVIYYKIIEQNNTVAQLLYLMIILTFVLRHRTLIATSVIYLSILLSRTHNAILLPLLSFQTVRFTQTENSALLFLVMQVPLSFYILGNSNSIATIDLQNAYVGLSKNHMELAGLVTFLSTFSGPLVVLSSFLFSSKQSLSLKHLNSWILWRLIVTFMVCLTCLIMKDHLFVWSVFSPRLLYEMAWIFFYATSFLIAYLSIEKK
jgi:ethanolaminephosphotransferase